MDPSDLANSWYTLLWQKEFIQRYRDVFLLYGGKGEPPELITDQILPELVYIRIASILDDVLSYYIDNNNLHIPKRHKQDLIGRINFLDEQKMLKNSKNTLHKIREKRNEIAHNRSTGFLDSEKEKMTWDKVDYDMDVVHKELQNILCLEDRPKCSFHARRSHRESNEPEVLCFRDFKLTLTFGKEKITSSWSDRLISREM